MARKAKKSDHATYAIAGRFDDKAASDLAGKLESNHQLPTWILSPDSQ